MAYVDPDFKTKKEFKEAVKAGRQLIAYTPGGMFPNPGDGWTTIEGPHYPRPHTWYAQALIVDGIVAAVK